MTELRVFLALGALCAFALLFTLWGIKSAVAPFCAVCAAALWFSLFGALGFLRLGGWLFYGLALAAVGVIVFLHGKKIKKLALPAFGFWFFVIGSLAAIALLWVKQPLFTDWDEFSFWGTAAKLVKLNDALYTVTPIGWAAVATQKPAMVVFGYFFQFFGKAFAEWQTYAAYAVFMLAGMAVLLAPFGKKHWMLALPMALLCVLTPYLFQHYQALAKVSAVYLTSMVDLPLGICFAGTMAAWYTAEKEKLRVLIPVCLGLATLTLMKDIALTFALVGAVILFFDVLLSKGAGPQRVTVRLKRAFLRLGLMVASVVLPFVLWEMYTSQVAQLNRVGDLAGGVGMLEMPFAFLGQLFSPEKSDLFTHVVNGMLRMFLTSRGTMLGSGAMILAVVWALLLAACLFTKDARHRRRCVLFGVFGTLGFGVYYLFLAMSYLYIMRPAEAWAFDSYDRYVYPIYMMLFLLAAMLLAQSVAAPKARWRILGKTVVLALAVVAFVRVSQLVPLNLSVLGVHTDQYNERRQFSQQVEELKARLSPDDKTFFVISDDLGIRFFMYCHEMLPYQSDYSYGGGAIQVRETLPDGTRPVREVTADELRQHLIETGCTAIYIDNIDENFINRFASLFSDRLKAHTQEGQRLYTVQQIEDELVIAPAPAT